MRALIATMTLGLLLTVGVAGAVADSECVQDAKGQRGQCYMACDEDFLITRDLCRNIDPECGVGCRVTLAECRDAIATALGHCVDGCREQLNADRAACPRRGRGRGRDGCIARAQTRASLCRDDCHGHLQVRPGRMACRQAFETCMRGCGSSAEPTPVPAPVPPMPTAVWTEPPPVPTVVATEAPPPPPVLATEPPRTPTPTRTATPRPQPTATILEPS